MNTAQVVQGGWQNDPLGDSPNPNCDIIKLEITEEELQITLAQTPILNESESVAYFYNIWVDTSGGEYYPDTKTWDPDHELYDYVAHFDWHYTNGQWHNDSYLLAFNFYIDEQGTKHEGTFYWNSILSKWQKDQPDQGVVIVNNNTIIFDINGAINREEPLGTGVVIRAVANAGSGLKIMDIAPNNGWVDEFDNLCKPPSDNTNETAFDLSLMILLPFIISVTRRKLTVRLQK